jgi:hypothetical protein
MDELWRLLAEGTILIGEGVFFWFLFLFSFLTILPSTDDPFDSHAGSTRPLMTSNLGLYEFPALYYALNDEKRKG